MQRKVNGLKLSSVSNLEFPEKKQCAEFDVFMVPMPCRCAPFKAGMLLLWEGYCRRTTCHTPANPCIRPQQNFMLCSRPFNRTGSRPWGNWQHAPTPVWGPLSSTLIWLSARSVCNGYPTGSQTSNTSAELTMSELPCTPWEGMVTSPMSSVVMSHGSMFWTLHPEEITGSGYHAMHTPEQFQYKNNQSRKWCLSSFLIIMDLSTDVSFPRAKESMALFPSRSCKGFVMQCTISIPKCEKGQMGHSAQQHTSTPLFSCAAMVLASMSAPGATPCVQPWPQSPRLLGLCPPQEMYLWWTFSGHSTNDQHTGAWNWNDSSLWMESHDGPLYPQTSPLRCCSRKLFWAPVTLLDWEKCLEKLLLKFENIAFMCCVTSQSANSEGVVDVVPWQTVCANWSLVKKSCWHKVHTPNSTQCQ